MRQRSYISILAGAVCCYAALGAVVRIVPGYAGADLHEHAFAVGLAIGAPAITGAAARPLGGHLADVRGTRLVVAAGAVVMAVGALPMFVHSYDLLIGSRLLTGLGEGAMMSATVLWLLRLTGPDRRGRALGHIGLANYAGLTVGPLAADALGGPSHPNRIFALATALPLAAAALAARASAGRVTGETRRREPIRMLVLLIAGPGIGLLLVNVGYATLLSFGAQAFHSGAILVLPAYAITVILVRTLGGSVPDRLGARATLLAAAPTAAAGLLIVALAPAAVLGLAGVVILGAGQGLAVPALGLLALAPVPNAQQGVASGLFFAWFDAGVGLGGPLAGLAAGIGGASTALAVAAGAVALATTVALRRSR